MAHQVIVGGTGGRGILTIGKLLAVAGMESYRHVTYFPVYGAAMRGGDSEVTVTLSDEEIASQAVLKTENAIVMDAAFLLPYESRLRSGGALLIDSSVVSEKTSRHDIRVLCIPAYQSAVDLGSGQVANFIMLGAYLEDSNVLPLQVVEETIEKTLAGTRREDLVALNRRALRRGAELCKTLASRTTNTISFGSRPL